jgi:putative chitinase
MNMTPVSALALEVILRHAHKANIERFVGWLNNAMERFDIVTPERQCAFIAQIGHESGHLRYVRELASGEAYDTGAKAKALGNTPEADGDGQRYKGRGLIQITGRDNYRACSLALFRDAQVLIDSPELLEEPEHAAMSAAWFWHSRGLNELADEGDFRLITKRINGGYTHFNQRSELWNIAKQVLV